MAKKVLWIVAACQLLSHSGFAQDMLDFGRGEAGEIRWTFTKVQPSPYLKNEDPKGAETLYRIDLLQDADEYPSSVYGFYGEILPILEFFRFDAPSELEGKRFLSQEKDPRYAYEFFRLTALHKGSYVRPTREELFQRTVNAFAESQCPSFDDVDTRWMFTCSSSVADLTQLNSAIAKKNPNVRLVKATAIYDENGNTPFYTVKGPADYWHLMNGDRVIDYITAGPYSDPINCASVRKKNKDD